MRRWQWAVVIAVISLASAYVILPLPHQLTTRLLPDAGDNVFTGWTMEHTIRALMHHPSQLWDGRIYYPRKNTIAWSDNLFAFTPIYAIFWFASGRNSVFAINMTQLFGYIFSVLGAFVLMRYLLREWKISLVASFMFGFSLVRTSNASHFQLDGIGFFFLALFCLIRYFEERRTSDAVWAGVLGALTFWSATYYFVLLLLVVPVFFLWWFVKDRARLLNRKTLVGMIPGALIFVVAIAATIGPYLYVKQDLHISRANSELTAISWRSFFHAPSSLIYKSFNLGTFGDLRRTYPGVIAMVFVGIALVVALFRKKNSIARNLADNAIFRKYLPPFIFACIGTLFLMQGGSHGVFSLPFRVARKVIPGVSSLRELTRFWVLPEFLICLVAGYGIGAMFSQLRTKVAGITTACLLVLLSAELLVRVQTVPTNLSHADRAVNRELAHAPFGAVADYPTPVYPWSNYANMADQMRGLDDNQPRFMGYSGIDPPELGQRLSLINALPDVRAVYQMHQLGVRYIVIHGSDVICDGKVSIAQEDATALALKAIPGVNEKIIGGDVLVYLPAEMNPQPPATFPPPIDDGIRCSAY